MKVALLTRAVFGLHGYGGMERHVLELARFLARSGVDVTVVTSSPRRGRQWTEPGVRVQIIRGPGLPLRGIPDRLINYPLWSRRAGAYLAQQDFDLVHAQGMSGWGYARQLAAGRAHAPLVINPQGMEEFKTAAAKRMAYFSFHLLARQAAQQATALIAADSAAAEEIPRYLHVPPQKVVVIPNGLDMELALSLVNRQTMNELAARELLASRSPILLSVGRLESNKGFHIMVEALARIRPSLPSTWMWVLVGEGSQRVRLQGLIQARKLSDHVRLLGNLNDITLHNLYELATLFVHPTLFEGSSLVTLEAMTHRRPIVASAVGGIPDKVVNGENGYLVQPGNPAELGEKILLTLRDARRLREMGERSYTIARETFDWPEAIQLTLALYQRLAPRPGSAPERVAAQKATSPAR